MRKITPGEGLFIKARVSLFRINIRLGGQHKCHSVRLRWYQVTASRVPRGIAASEDSPCPCIS